MTNTTSTLASVPFTHVRVEDRFWSPRIETNRQSTIPFAIARCEETGRIDNFAKAGGLMPGEFRGIYYDDSDVFKVIEGIACSLATHPDPRLDAYLDGLIEKIAAAQESDGYLYTNRTIDPSNVQKAAGPERWSNVKDSHELYNVGHLYEAAVAHYHATGKTALLDVALKNAELILKEFGPSARHEAPGHQEIEIGLAKLYLLRGDRRYLELAKFFLDQRGHTDNRASNGTYDQDHKPVIEQTEVVGHAVRALYMYSAMADVASLTGDASYLRALDALWQDMVGGKMALTGGVGARKSGEAFGDPYELPNHTCYNETCASIANVFWQYRMFLLSGQSRYLDVAERVLYNGLISGVSLSGDRFFYVNPLASDGVTPFNYGGEVGRAPWFKCSCCPVNVVRFLASLPGYVYATGPGALYVALYVGGEATLDLPGAGKVRIVQETDYPWEGKVQLTIHPEQSGEFALHLRIPGWSRGEPVPTNLYRYLPTDPAPEPTLSVNGQPAALRMRDGFAVIQRTWQAGDVVVLDLPMPVRRVVAHEQVTENTGRIALERGPLVYCVEQVDNAAPVEAIALPDDAPITTEQRPDLLGGVVVLRSTAPEIAWVPYYAWNHRGTGAMAVWIKRGLAGEM